jgi:hypothetical protein
LLVRNGRAAEALPVYSDALVGIRKYVGEQSPNIIAVLNRTAVANQAAGHYDAAESAFAAATAAAERDHADDARVREMLKSTRERLDRIKAGDQLKCGEP